MVGLKLRGFNLGRAISGVAPPTFRLGTDPQALEFFAAFHHHALFLVGLELEVPTGHNDMDLSMPQLNGVEATGQILKTLARLRVS
jgi:hypothetical protein